MSRIDEFFRARLKLTAYYSLTAIIILGGSSILLYNTILLNLSDSIKESVRDPLVAKIVEDRAQDILLSRFLTIDLVLIFVIVIFGFLLTYKVLEPIKVNLEKQKRFIADASHELRTPVAVVISGLEVNLNNKNLNLEGAKKTLESTLEEMREFSKLSNSLLDISTYDLPIKVTYEKISINELINSIVEKNRSLGEFKNIKIESKIENKATVLGNKIELGRVFSNILDNAIKYTENGGRILLQDKIVGEKYVLNIIDTGIGINKYVIDKIFDPFFREDSSRGTSGAGLGLTLAKKIIENHKGAISIKSETKDIQNKGTNVTVTLPISS